MKKILVLAANPRTTTRLRLDEEVRDIQDGLSRAQYRNDFQLISRFAVRPRDIQRAMLDETPQIVHFSGHGEGEEGLVFEDDAGNVRFIQGEALAGLFELFANNVECVLLNGCYSNMQAEAIVKHIDYVIGMSQSISDRAAIEFAVAFYDAIGAGRGYEFAYKLGCTAIHLNASPSQTSTRKLTPINTAKESKGEHLIPILLKRLEILDQQSAEEESKFEKTIAVEIKEVLEWLSRNEKSLSQDAKSYAMSKHPKTFEDLSEEEQDDFRWEIEKYIESVYLATLSNTFDLLDEPVIRPSVSSHEAYQAAFEFIKNKIPRKLQEQAKELMSEHFDYLLTRFFVGEDIEFSETNIKANQYREQVREYLENHKLANYEEVLLEELRQEIELSVEEAKSILSEEYAPILAAQQAYRNRLNGLIRGGFYPFNNDINAELKKIQKRRNLTNEEVAEISQPIFELAEQESQDKQAQQK